MRRIEPTGAFKRDFRREMRGQHRVTLDRDLAAVVTALAQDQPLAMKYRDHGATFLTSRYVPAERSGVHHSFMGRRTSTWHSFANLVRVRPRKERGNADERR
jgi:mRNA-degrading endonuclease YafQ of YafQ-DinJ toxin-antitoxin module